MVGVCCDATKVHLSGWSMHSLTHGRLYVYIYIHDTRSIYYLSADEHVFERMAGADQWQSLLQQHSPKC